MIVADELPEGWVIAKVETLFATLKNGKTLHQGWSPQCESEPAHDDTQWAVLKTTAIQDGNFLSQHNKKLPQSLQPDPTLEVSNGDLLITCAGPRVRCGVACLVRNTRPCLMISGKMYRFRANENLITPEFFEFLLRCPVFQSAIDSIKTGISDSGVNLTHARFRELEIALPPLNEQHRILGVLNIAQHHSREAAQALVDVPKLLEQYRQSVLAAAFRGDLTSAWREKNPSTEAIQKGIELPSDAPESWIWRPLNDVCDPARDICYGVIKLGDPISDGVPCLRTSDVRALHIDTTNVKRISSAVSSQYSRSVLQGGEVLVNVRGSLGGVAAVPQVLRGWNISREVAIVPIVGVYPEFLALWIASPEAQSWLTAVAKGVAYTGINIADLRKLAVPILPQEEQLQIIDLVNGMLRKIAQIEHQIQIVATELDALDQSLLAKAFRGELVPQDPADEPASALLASLRSGVPVRTRQPITPAKLSRFVLMLLHHWKGAASRELVDRGVLLMMDDDLRERLHANGATPRPKKRGRQPVAEVIRLPNLLGKMIDAGFIRAGTRGDSQTIHAADIAKAKQAYETAETTDLERLQQAVKIMDAIEDKTLTSELAEAFHGQTIEELVSY